ncbi:hypothetical protein D910_07529 [Dendroctonus ponderosae]|uniref:Uncharacterized protein n=1 Tax=Dendroctonus ponderosae TaxID=77166 RepID=U4UJJ8_DENPD|nr:hypothetical protein D910_07529 [Dendroctonus ponderosae]
MCVSIESRPKLLGRAIVALAKVGDELYMEAKPDKLSFLTLNQAKTICAQMHLLDSFFSLYDIDRPKQPRNVPICCKVHVKTMLQLLKGTQLDRKLESLKIELNPNSDSIQFKLKYKVDDIVLSQVLHLMEPEVLQLDDYSGPKNNNICAGNEFYNNLLVLFSNSDDDITLEISETKMIARNYVNGRPLCVTLKNPTFEMLFIVSSFNPYADGQSSTGTTSLPTRMNRVANSDTLPANKSGAQQDLTQEDLLAIANEDWQAFDERTNNSKAALRRISKEPIFNESREGGKRILSNPRALDYPLMSTPLPVIFIIYFWFKFVLTWAPNYMKDRPPFELKKIIMLYNIMQIIANGYILFFIFLARNEIDWTCGEIDFSDSYWARKFLSLTYLFFIVKIMDLLDTIQFAFLICIYGQLFFRSNCNYPKLVPFFFVPQNIFMIILFGDFYIHNYILKKKGQIPEQSESEKLSL